MSESSPRANLIAATLEILGSARFNTALTTSVIGVAMLCFLLRSVVGWPGLMTILALQLLLAAGAMVARRGTIEWQGILPVSLIVFIGWASLSVVWSDYKGATVAGLASPFCRVWSCSISEGTPALANTAALAST